MLSINSEIFPEAGMKGVDTDKCKLPVRTTEINSTFSSE